MTALSGGYGPGVQRCSVLRRSMMGESLCLIRRSDVLMLDGSIWVLMQRFRQTERLFLVNRED
jgi:hypothetical protein